MSIQELTRLTGGSGILVSRLKHSGSQSVIMPALDTRLRERDVVILVGLPSDIDAAVKLLGRNSTDTVIEGGEVQIAHYYITRRTPAFKTPAQLNLEGRFGVKLTRVYRSGLELPATPNLVLHFGDRVRVVGTLPMLEEVSKILGNEIKALREPDLLSVFFGIGLGVVLGSLPLALPGLPAPVRLGLAAGPLVVAILLSRFGGIRGLPMFLDHTAGLLMRDLGISLFFATVGLAAGKTFYQTFTQFGGFLWMAYGAVITFVPAIVTGLLGRWVFKLNFLQLSGLLGGANTSPTALSFSTRYFDTDIPVQAYSTVFPLTTLLRILVAQLFVLYLL